MVTLGWAQVQLVGGTLRLLRSFAVATTVLMLGSCALFEADTGVEYTGIYDSEVGSCAAIAMGGSLRADQRTPSSIWVRNVTVELESHSADYQLLEYEIAAETHVLAGSSAIYAWQCHVVVDYGERSLNARLESFELTD